MLPLIWHTITELNYGGAEKLLVNMLRHIHQSPDRAFRHRVVALYAGDTPLAEQIRQMGVPVTDLQMKSNGRFTAPYRFWRLLRRERPFVIHNWLYHASLFGRVLGRWAGTPIIVTARHSVHFGSPLREKLHHWSGRFDDQTILICDFMRQQEIGPADRYAVIYNGISPLEFPPRNAARAALRAELNLPPDALIALTTGRLHPVKGHADLIPAASLLLDQYPKLHFVWAGDGEQRPFLEQAVASRPVRQHLHLLGNRDDVAHLLAASDLFLMPSRWEGISVAILEAMAAGLPVVATAVGGTPELVSHNQTGLLVPPQSPEALAQAIRQLLDQPELAAQMGQNGRQRAAAQFTIERMVQQTEALYNRLLTEKNLRQSA